MQQRMTRQKRLILEITQSHHDHPTADMIYIELRAKDNRISRGTVYRNLEQLADSGLLLHVKVPGADRFDSRRELHYHIICRSCGFVSDAPPEYREELDRQVAEKTSFLVERHCLVFEGLCPDCLKKTVH